MHQVTKARQTAQRTAIAFNALNRAFFMPSSQVAGEMRKWVSLCGFREDIMDRTPCWIFR